MAKNNSVAAKRARNNKAKGREYQKDICRRISKLTGFDFGKDKPIESRIMGQAGADVRMEKRVLRVFPFSVECKVDKNNSIKAALKQTKKNRLPGTRWILFKKVPREMDCAIMDFDTFLKILEVCNASISDQPQ